MTPQREEARRLLRLAERDFDAFELLAAGRDETHAAAGFHAQQAVEKALKALLCLRDIDFPRTHDLENLLALLSQVGASPDLSSADARALTPYAVSFRYDDEFIALLTEVEMRNAASRLIHFLAATLNES